MVLGVQVILEMPHWTTFLSRKGLVIKKVLHAENGSTTLDLCKSLKVCVYTPSWRVKLFLSVK